MGTILGRFLILLLLLAGEAVAQDFIREELIPSTIPRNSQLIPTGETNAICVANTPGPAPAFSLCSTVNVTGKTVLYKIPEYAFASIPAGTPLVIVTNSGSSSVCNGSGSTKVPCWHNGTSWTPLGAGGGASLPIDLASQVSGLLPAANANNAILHNSAAYCADAGASDDYACNLTPAPASYVTGARYRFKANTANTGSARINFNSLGLITIKKAVGGVTSDLADNDIRANQIVEVVFDGTNMQMQSTLGNAPGGAGLSFLSEDADTLNATRNMEMGNVATNSWTPDPSAISGHITRTLKSVAGTEAVTTGSLPTGNRATFDSSGRIVDGGASDVSARVYHNAAQSINASENATLAFNNERYDTHTMHDNATTNSRITITSGAGAGKYLIGANVRFAINDTGVRIVSIVLNGTTTIAESRLNAVTAGGFGTVNPPVTTIYNLSVNDYVEVVVYQSSTGALDVQSVGNYSPEFFIQKVGW